LSKAVLLSAGRDPFLLSTRRSVLESAGYSVVTAVTAPELIKLFFAGDFDVVIFCHTIPQEEKIRTANAIRDHSRFTAILALSNTDGQRWPFADETIVADPVALLAAIPELIGRSGNRQESIPAD
jgi:CheY-like chemotaxis protein